MEGTTKTDLHSQAFLREWQIIGSTSKNIPALIPIGRTTFLNRVKSGEYPQPIKLGSRSVAWRVEDIRILIEKIDRA